jgi:hypothetical protein
MIHFLDDSFTTSVFLFAHLLLCTNALGIIFRFIADTLSAAQRRRGNSVVDLISEIATNELTSRMFGNCDSLSKKNFW